jgi:hypothetical protein
MGSLAGFGAFWWCQTILRVGRTQSSQHNFGVSGKPGGYRTGIRLNLTGSFVAVITFVDSAFQTSMQKAFGFRNNNYTPAHRKNTCRKRRVARSSLVGQRSYAGCREPRIDDERDLLGYLARGC